MKTAEEKITITFENSDKKKKAVVKMNYDGKTADVKLTFTPKVDKDSEELYATVAMNFLKFLSQ